MSPTRRLQPQMLPKLIDVLDLLERVAPTRLAESWDNPGLQIGSYSQEIRKIFLALDPTLTALKAASKRNAQVLLTHHPLISKALSHLDISIYPGNVIIEAVKREISVIAVHTNLDIAHGGINDILADLLDLQHVEVLGKSDGMDGMGLGRIGDLPKDTKLSVLSRNIKKILGAKKLRIVGQRDVLIHRLAIVGGSGGSLISLASRRGADLLLTGDMSHHNALEAESLGIALIDGGHFYTEKTAFRVFAERLKDMISAQGWEVTVEVNENELDPMQVV